MLFERLGEINQGRQKPKLGETFAQFTLERWEPALYPTLRGSTSANYRVIVRKHLLPHFGEMRMSEINGADIQMFLARKAQAGLSPRTLLSLRNRLSKIFSSARLWGFLSSNPAQGARVPSLSDVRERRALTPQLVARLLGELAEPYRSMVHLAVLSGMRRGEILGLKWKYVNWSEGSITVAETDYEGHASAPKTQASRRKVFVDEAALQLLRSHRGASDPFPDSLVFPCGSGRAFNAHNLRCRVLIPACRRAGIPECGWHTFRYTYTTWANPTGESIKAVQNQLGHTDARLTVGVYTQSQPEAQRQIAHKVAGKLSGGLLQVAPQTSPSVMTEGDTKSNLIRMKERA